MTPISLYEGCFVKTDSGEVFGPWTTKADEDWLSFGDIYISKVFHPEGVYKTSECETVCLGKIVEAYPSLSAASAANPEI